MNDPSPLHSIDSPALSADLNHSSISNTIFAAHFNTDDGRTEEDEHMNHSADLSDYSSVDLSVKSKKILSSLDSSFSSVTSTIQALSKVNRNPQSIVIILLKIPLATMFISFMLALIYTVLPDVDYWFYYLLKNQFWATLTLIETAELQIANIPDVTEHTYCLSYLIGFLSTIILHIIVYAIGYINNYYVASLSVCLPVIVVMICFGWDCFYYPTISHHAMTKPSITTNQNVHPKNTFATMLAAVGPTEEVEEEKEMQQANKQSDVLSPIPSIASTFEVMQGGGDDNRVDSVQSVYYERWTTMRQTTHQLAQQTGQQIIDWIYELRIILPRYWMYYLANHHNNTTKTSTLSQPIPHWNIIMEVSRQHHSPGNVTTTPILNQRMKQYWLASTYFIVFTINYVFLIIFTFTFRQMVNDTNSKSDHEDDYDSESTNISSHSTNTVILFGFFVFITVSTGFRLVLKSLGMMLDKCNQQRQQQRQQKKKESTNTQQQHHKEVEEGADEIEYNEEEHQSVTSRASLAIQIPYTDNNTNNNTIQMNPLHQSTTTTISTTTTTNTTHNNTIPPNTHHNNTQQSLSPPPPVSMYFLAEVMSLLFYYTFYRVLFSSINNYLVFFLLQCMHLFFEWLLYAVRSSEWYYIFTEQGIMQLQSKFPWLMTTFGLIQVPRFTCKDWQKFLGLDFSIRLIALISTGYSMLCLLACIEYIPWIGNDLYSNNQQNFHFLIIIFVISMIMELINAYIILQYYFYCIQHIDPMKMLFHCWSSHEFAILSLIIGANLLINPIYAFTNDNQF